MQLTHALVERHELLWQLIFLFNKMAVYLIEKRTI